MPPEWYLGNTFWKQCYKIKPLKVRKLLAPEILVPLYPLYKQVNICLHYKVSPSFSANKHVGWTDSGDFTFDFQGFCFLS